MMNQLDKKKYFRFHNILLVAMDRFKKNHETKIKRILTSPIQNLVVEKEIGTSTAPSCSRKQFEARNGPFV